MDTDSSRGEGKSCVMAKNLCSPYTLFTECCIPLGFGRTLVLAQCKATPPVLLRRATVVPQHVHHRGRAAVCISVLQASPCLFAQACIYPCVKLIVLGWLTPHSCTECISDYCLWSQDVILTIHRSL